MPSTVRRLMESTGLIWGGSAPWGVPVCLAEPGVYLVALTQDPDEPGGTLPAAPVECRYLEQLLAVCPRLTLDERAGPTANDLAERIGSYWLGDETILYIGLASVSVQRRTRQFERHQLGRRSPHKGGWWLKTLSSLGQMHVHYAPSNDPRRDERVLLCRFAENVSQDARRTVPDSDRLGPFANLAVCNGRRQHGIRGATCDPSDPKRRQAR